MALRLNVIAIPAAGKTSATQLLAAKNPSIFLVPEPVEKWRKTGHLERFYQDKKKYAFDMQWNAVKTRFEDLQESIAGAGPLDGKVIVMDGCMESDRYGFVQALFEDGFMTPEDKARYETNYDEMMSGGIRKDEFFVFLHCDPKVCLARAKIRARSEETGLSLDYLEHLNQTFEASIQRPEFSKKTIILDVTTKNLEEVVQALDDIINGVKAQGNLDFKVPLY